MRKWKCWVVPHPPTSMACGPCSQNWDCSSPCLWPDSTPIPRAIWPSEAWSMLDGGRRKDHHDPLHLSCEETEAKMENGIYSRPGREEAAESGPKSKFSSQSNIGFPSHCVKPWSSFKNRNQPRLCLLARVSTKGSYWPTPRVIRNPFYFFYKFLKHFLLTQTMNYIWPPCLLLCVSLTAAALFISSICLRQMLVLWIKQPVSVFSSIFYPSYSWKRPIPHQAKLAPNAQLPSTKRGNKNTWKFPSYNLCIPLKHMKMFFFEYTKWYIGIFIPLRSITHLLYVWSYLGTGDAKRNSTASDLEWLLPWWAKSVSEDVITATWSMALDEWQREKVQSHLRKQKMLPKEADYSPKSSGVRTGKDPMRKPSLALCSQHDWKTWSRFADKKHETQEDHVIWIRSLAHDIISSKVPRFSCSSSVRRGSPLQKYL